MLLWLLSAGASARVRSAEEPAFGGERSFESTVVGRTRDLQRSILRITNPRAWRPSSGHRLTPPDGLGMLSDILFLGWYESHAGPLQLLGAIDVMRPSELAFPYDATAPPSSSRT